MPSGTAATHALVIGVSRYEHLPPPGADPSQDPLKFDLVGATTPAIGAFRFAQWLKDRSRSDRRGSLAFGYFCHPPTWELEEELGAVANQVEPATRSNVRRALREWQDVCREQPDGMAVLYCSDHGASQSKTDALRAPGGLRRRPAGDGVLSRRGAGPLRPGRARPCRRRSSSSSMPAASQPDAFSKYRTAGSGLGLPEEWDGDDKYVTLSGHLTR